ncbi:hypothetical protein DPMN_122962 [Dreissena polymorpha]|uniref:Uncharacterized protein n=1 Tax=Dreissena polymorpha TaxID=45954 RepID=A0A9D4GTK0_DREPO|nr:hypothetical protein DPMN_122962 [Dreissena polymorpha]
MTNRRDSVMSLLPTTQTQRCHYGPPHTLSDVTLAKHTDSVVSLWPTTRTQ